MEKYSSWWRGAPAKGVGRVTGAGVRVSPSPPNKDSPQKRAVFIYITFLIGNYGEVLKLVTRRPC